MRLEKRVEIVRRRAIRIPASVKEEAYRFVSQEVLDSKVTLQFNDEGYLPRDEDGALLAYVAHSGLLLNGQLVYHGLATHEEESGGRYTEFLQFQERLAREASRGLHRR